MPTETITTNHFVPAPGTDDLAVWDGRDAQQAEQWLAAWTDIAKGDFFSHPSFVAQSAESGEVPLCVVHTSATGQRVLYSFLVRPVAQTACGVPLATPLWDAYTPLLYGGPICRDASAATLTSFWEAFRAWARASGIISEFIRMSPIEAHRLPYPGEVTEQAPHIVRELASWSADDLWMDMSKDLRRGVKKARSLGVEITFDTTGERLDEFLSIYYETMDRANAAPRFYFDREFFEALHEAFEGLFVYVYSALEGRTLGVLLELIDDDTGYSYLGGTRTDALPTKCTVLAQYEAIQFARSRGLSNYVLTGGVTNTTDDSLLQFKRKFAPAGDAQYFTGSQILDQDRYRELCCSTSRDGAGSGFFPAYRSVADAVGCTAHRTVD